MVGKQTIHHHLSKPSVPCRQQKARHRMSVVKKTPYLISLSCQLYHHQKSQSKTSDNHVKVFWRYFEAFDFPPTNLFDICPHLLSLKRNHARKVVIFGSYASLPKANLLHLFFLYHQLNFIDGMLTLSKRKLVCFELKITQFVRVFGGLYIYGCFRKLWYPQIIHFNRVFHYKPYISSPSG